MIIVMVMMVVMMMMLVVLVVVLVVLVVVISVTILNTTEKMTIIMTPVTSQIWFPANRSPLVNNQDPQNQLYAQSKIWFQPWLRPIRLLFWDI